MISSNDRMLSKIQLVKILKSCKPETRIHIIKFLNDDAINILSEITYNLLFNNMNLSNKSKKNLVKKYSSRKKDLKKIADKSITIQRRRKLLIQDGGFLGTLLGIALPILSGETNLKYRFCSFLSFFLSFFLSSFFFLSF